MSNSYKDDHFQQRLYKWMHKKHGAIVLGIPPAFVDLTGSWESAAFLAQCIYWSDRGGNQYGFYKTAQQWYEEIRLRRHTLERCQKDCARWVTISVHKANGTPTRHYKVNYKQLVEDLNIILLSRGENPISIDDVNCTEPANESQENAVNAEMKQPDMHMVRKTLTKISTENTSYHKQGENSNNNGNGHDEKNGKVLTPSREIDKKLPMNTSNEKIASTINSIDSSSLLPDDRSEGDRDSDKQSDKIDHDSLHLGRAASGDDVMTSCVDDKASRPEDAYKQRLRNALMRGDALQYFIKSYLSYAFNININWQRKDWAKCVRFIMTRPPDEKIERFVYWWKNEDWRGKRGQPPTASQIMECWPLAFKDQYRPFVLSPEENEFIERLKYNAGLFA